MSFPQPPSKQAVVVAEVAQEVGQANKEHCACGLGTIKEGLRCVGHGVVRQGRKTVSAGIGPGGFGMCAQAQQKGRGIRQEALGRRVDYDFLEPSSGKRTRSGFR